MPAAVERIKKAFEDPLRVAMPSAAWLFLNIQANVDLTGRGNTLSNLLALNPEIMATVALTGLWALLRLPYHRALLVLLTAANIFTGAFRIADRLVPAYLARPFDLYSDTQFFPDLIFLLYTTLPLWRFAAYCLLAVAVLGFAAAAVWLALKTFYSCMGGRSRRPAAAVVTVVWLVCISHLSVGGRAVVAPAALPRVAEEINAILRLGETRHRHLAALRKAAEKSASHLTPLTGLQGGDVYVFFVESYGCTVYKDPRHARLVVPAVRAAARALAANGYVFASSYFQSPAFGGASWLAHGSLASGVAITGQLQYELLLTSSVPPIAEFFNRAGYRTVRVMPGTLWEWPAGEYFRYQQKYYAFDFDYRGPAFGWAPMPDQFVLDSIYRREIKKRDRPPLFIQFVLVSSHAPFDEQPPYISDWSRIGGGAIYRSQEPVRYPVAWPGLKGASKAYASSIVYDLEVLTDFLCRVIDDAALVIVTGDHQPNVKVTGPDQPWSVPVHVVSRNPRLVAPFIRRGFTEGLVPSRPPPHAGIENLFWILLEDFSQGPGSRHPR